MEIKNNGNNFNDEENIEGFEELMMARHGKLQAPEIVKYMYAPALPPDADTYKGHSKCNIAQAIMLYEEGLINSETAAKICSVLLEIDTLGPDNFPFDPKVGMAFFNYETYLMKKLGHQIGGKLHMGRSRIDFNTTSARLAIRGKLGRLLLKIIEFRKILTDIADEHKETLMPGYTHMQSAQPTTYAEYLLGINFALKRCYDRLEFLYHQFNRSPLGSAATAGTGWPLNRERLSYLLGFDGVLDNDHDAGQNYDGILAITGSVNVLMNTFSRFATDLYIWCTNEFDIVELDGAFAGTSSIMPQKKNPYPFEIAIGRAGEVAGFYNALLNSLTCGSSGFIIMRHSGEVYCGKSISYAIDVFDMMGPVMKTLIIKKERMAKLASEFFSMSVDLGDVISKKTGLNSRDSHLIVGNLINYCSVENIKPQNVNLDLVKAIASKLGHCINELSETDVRNSMDAWHFITKRDGIGGPAPKSTARQVEQQRCVWNIDKTSLTVEKRRVGERSAELYGIAKKLATRYSS